MFQRHDHPTCPPLINGERAPHKCQGRWVGRVDLDVMGGERRRKTIYARTQREAVRKLTEAKDAVRKGDRSTRSDTLSAWLDYWLTEVCPNKTRMKPKTLRTYQSYVEQHIKPAIGRKKLNRLTPEDVRGVMVSVMEKRRPNGAPLSSTTAAHAYRILHTALEDAVKDGRLLANVADRVSVVPNAAAPKDSLSLDQFRQLMGYLDGDRLQSRWAFALFTGARQGECLGLTWQNVDLTNGVADLAWQLQRIPYRHGCEGECGRRPDRCPARELAVRPGFDYRVLDGNLCLQRPKTTGSTRVIPLPGPLVVALKERRALYEQERRNYTRDHGLVWARPDGRPIDGRKDWAEWSAHLDAIGVAHLPLHSARHTASTVLQALKVSENVRMAIMGHSEAATQRRYAYVDMTLMREAMDAYGRALSNSVPSSSASIAR